jgi:hypothetical protein
VRLAASQGLSSMELLTRKFSDIKSKLHHSTLLLIHRLQILSAFGRTGLKFKVKILFTFFVLDKALVVGSFVDISVSRLNA